VILDPRLLAGVPVPAGLDDTGGATPWHPRHALV